MIPIDQVGIVVIGRNEEYRLEASLRSATETGAKVLYVDSDSTDRSCSIAENLGVSILRLCSDKPLSAARSRNEGFQWLLKSNPDLKFIQFMDGDCELHVEWIPFGLRIFSEQSEVGVVCGYTDERFPDKSIYNLLCAMEWDRGLGSISTCAGNALIRSDVFMRSEGYNSALIAGEEAELCGRIKRLGFEVIRVPHNMVYHDAAIFHFSQWFKRSIRAGYAAGLGCLHYSGELFRVSLRQMLRIVFWSLVLPLVTIGLILISGWSGFFLFFLYPVVTVKNTLYRHNVHKDPIRPALLYSFFCTLSMWPQMIGGMRCIKDYLLKKGGRIIEYK